MDTEPSTIMDLVFGVGAKEKNGQMSLLGEKLLPYKAVMCRQCGKIQVTMGEEMFRCKECNKVMKYRKKGVWNVRLKDFATFEDALRAAKKWAMEEYLKENKDFTAKIVKQIHEQVKINV